MPSGGIHLCVGKRVADILNIKKSMNFYVGVVSADSWRNSTSTKIGTHFLSSVDSLDYNYDLFYRKYLKYMDNEFVIGYLIHLITDKYWYSNNFITSNILEDQYIDFKRACSILIHNYDIPRLELPSDLFNPILELDGSGIISTINYLNGVNYVSGSTDKFNINELVYYIEKTSYYVVDEIERLRDEVSL